MPRHNITKYKDEVRGEMPHDESSTSRQTSGWKEGKCLWIFDVRCFSDQNDLVNPLYIFELILFNFCAFSGASQAGMTGFGAFRNNTIFLLQSKLIFGSDFRISVNIYRRIVSIFRIVIKFYTKN
jgi:hypothetical protein